MNFKRGCEIREVAKRQKRSVFESYTNYLECLDNVPINTIYSYIESETDRANLARLKNLNVELDKVYREIENKPQYLRTFDSRIIWKEHFTGPFNLPDLSVYNNISRLILSTTELKKLVYHNRNIKII